MRSKKIGNLFYSKINLPNNSECIKKKNHLLFACDKLGSIDLYQLDGNSRKNSPRHLRHFELFPGNTASKQPQIIETFTVYTPFIVVSARKKYKNHRIHVNSFFSRFE